MKDGFYIVNSPDFLSECDFKKFPLWGEWNEPEEIPLLKSLCESEEEYQKLIISPYEEGKETYYPIFDSVLPNHKFLYAASKVCIGNKEIAKGYICIDSGRVAAICIWLGGKEFQLLSKERLLALDENPSIVKEISKLLHIMEFNEIRYETNLKRKNGENLAGSIVLK